MKLLNSQEIQHFNKDDNIDLYTINNQNIKNSETQRQSDLKNNSYMEMFTIVFRS